MSLSLLTRQPVTWDSEAASYILQVEAADGQSLEPTVARAINTFVIDCKVRGIWGAIKSCCLLCGARTLNGALKPLKGTAPTNFNFINSDYNRETGLKGDGSSKYINTNISATSPLVGQDNLHFSTYITATNSTAASRSYIADGGRNMYRTISSTATQFNINASFGSSGGDSAMVASTGFCGLSRNNGQNFTIRVIGSNRVYSAASIAESGYLGGTFRIFGRNGNLVMQEFSDGRISFYSIGEAVNLRLLDQCVSKFNLAIDRSLNYQVSDPDASRYIQAVENIDGLHMEPTLRQAIEAFVIVCKNDNNWNKLGTCLLLCGARNLSSSLVPLRGPSPTNNNFISTDYSRAGSAPGLVGNTTNKYLATNRSASVDSINDFSFGVYITQAPSVNNGQAISHSGGGSGGSSGMTIGSNGTILIYNRDVNSDTLTNQLPVNGFFGSSRGNSSSYIVRSLGQNTTINRNSVTIAAGSWTVFSRSDVAWFDGRLAFYFTGASLDLQLLDSRITTLVNFIKTL